VFRISARMSPTVTPYVTFVTVQAIVIQSVQ
jgi:hypothetical protein